MGISRRTLALALSLTPHLGGKRITSILARNDLLARTPDEFSKLPAAVLQEEYRLPTKVAEEWTSSAANRLNDAEGMESRFDRMGISMVTAADAHYPRRIEEMHVDPPGVLFLYGNTRLLEARTFAVMSSRKSPAAALDLIEKLTEGGVLSGETLVAGHDTPEYQRAAVVPLRWGAPRILVLDRGFESALGEELRDEPFRTARLWRYEFDPSTDLVVSAVRPEKGYHVSGNQTRDNLIAGLAARLDFVSISPGGNMERLAKAGLKSGRPVRVSEMSTSIQELASMGAALI